MKTVERSTKLILADDPQGAMIDTDQARFSFLSIGVHLWLIFVVHIAAYRDSGKRLVTAGAIL